MQKFTPLTSRVVVLARNDIDTDQIIPARFLTATEKSGLGRHLFAGWRYDAAGGPVAEFALNRPDAPGARILLAGHNFGCGSSREHAPWALMDFGFSAVIATSFADIFTGNAHKNGLLPVIIPPAAHAALLARLAAKPDAEAAIDLAGQTLTLPGGGCVEFPVDPFAKICLLEGTDELDFIRKHDAQIGRYEAALTRGERS